MMDSIDDDAAGRVESELDIYDDDSLKDIQHKISSRFDKNFNPKQKRGFAQKIYDQRRSGWKSESIILDKATSLGGKGFDLKRHPMVRDSTTGKYIGARKNIIITSRTGTRVMITNTKTGKRGVIIYK